MSSGADAFLISPGPKTPDQAGVSLDLVAACATPEAIGVALVTLAVPGVEERGGDPDAGREQRVAGDEGDQVRVDLVVPRQRALQMVYRLAEAAEVVQEPIDQDYGIRDCAVRDPAGILIRIQERR